MRRRAFALGAMALFVGGEAEAASWMRGQWEIRVPKQPGYAGMVLVDGDGRVTWDSPVDAGAPAKFRGYIAKVDDQKIKIVFTNGIGVAHTDCSIQSSDLLFCRNIRVGGAISDAFFLARIGAGPARLR